MEAPNKNDTSWSKVEMEGKVVCFFEMKRWVVVSSLAFREGFFKFSIFFCWGVGPQSKYGKHTYLPKLYWEGCFFLQKIGEGGVCEACDCFLVRQTIVDFGD